MPVSPVYPVGVFVGVSAFGPMPEAVPQGPFHFLERPLRRTVSVIVGPAPNHGVELVDQVALADSAVAANKLPHLFQERVRVLPGRLGEQFSAELAEGLSEEVKPLCDVRDARLLWRELQAPIAQKLFDQWLDFIFQQFLGAAGDDEVVRIAHEVHFRIVPLPLEFLPREVLFESLLQSVQCQVGQRGRDYALYTMDNNPRSGR